MTTARLDIRLDEKIKARAEKASAFLGLKSLTEYVVKLMDEDSAQVIAQHESITVQDDVFDQFVNACEQANPPNQTLRDAAVFAKERNFT